MKHMKKVVFDNPGTPDVLYTVDVDIPKPAPDEVLLETTAIGVNYIDVYLRSGQLPQKIEPHTGIGVESVGRITALGQNVTDLVVGDRAATIGGTPGSYSSHRIFPRSRIIPLPDSISDDTAAALFFKGLTVEYLINRCFAVQDGQSVLWHAAAGGVGQIAGQWLSQRDINLIGIVGSEAKIDTAKAHGFSTVLLSTSATLEADIQQLTDGQGVDVAYDSVGAATFDISLKALKPRGTLVLFGNASGKVVGFDTSRLGAQGSVFLTRPSIAHYIADPDEFQAAAQNVITAIETGVITPGAINIFDLKDVVSVHQALEKRQLVGSTILHPADPETDAEAGQ